MSSNTDLHKVKEKIKEEGLKALSLSIRFLPLWINAIGAGVLISTIIDKNPGFKQRLKELDGKVFLFDAVDIKKGFYMHIKDNDIRILPHYTGEVDVTMKGDMEVLFGLLMGKVDPDTVFFSRRLEISGDTGAAIHFKNILNE